MKNKKINDTINMYLYFNNKKMKKKAEKKLKKIYKTVKAWDKRNTTLPSWLYMSIFLTASLVVFDTIKTLTSNI